MARPLGLINSSLITLTLITMATINGNKRRRHDGVESCSPINAPKLGDFPDALLATVASYLPQTSCAFFAVAMMSSPNEDSSLQLSSVSNTILAQHQNWDTLDFEDIDKSCQKRLTDRDIHQILVCIDAVNNLRSLKLTHCFNVTGAGLEPLRGSTVLERIDLSLVGAHESPVIEPAPPLSVDAVVPILDSVIGREGNALVHIQLPKKWREEKSGILSSFLERFDGALNSRRFHCSLPSCEQTCQGRADSPLVPWEDRDDWYGMTSITCFQCQKHFCKVCGDDNMMLDFCKCCEKFYCQDCSMVEYCQGSNCSSAEQPASCKFCGVVKYW